MTKPFSTEADLCAAFIAAIPKDWTAYPEWGGFDILLVGPGGIQIGIEAKLALNAKVLMQAMEPSRAWSATKPGPDFRAVLVPDTATSTLEPIAKALGVTVIRMRAGEVRDGYFWTGGRGVTPFSPSLPRDTDHYWHDFWPWRRVPMPEVIPDCAAGCPAPVRITEWKLKAIKIAILLDRRPVTRADFKALDIHMSRWSDCGWIVRGEARGTWVWGEYHPDFRRDHPRNYDEIAAMFDRWAPPEVTPPAAQEALL